MCFFAIIPSVLNSIRANAVLKGYEHDLLKLVIGSALSRTGSNAFGTG